MQISYKNKGIEKVCTDASEATKKHGGIMAEKIIQRINEISSAESVEFMIKYKIGRCHPLKNNRKGEYAVDLVNPYRLVFRIKTDEIEIANICEIVDYH